MLHVVELTKRTPGGRELLRGITFRVRPGEFVGVLGPSGAGKSLTIRCLLGLLRPDSGSICFRPDRQHTFDMATARRRNLHRARSRIGTIFQNHNLVPRLTVLENVLMGRLGQISPLRSCLLGFTNREAAEALQVLQRLEMDSFADRKAGSLSGGEMQRVAIARAMFQSPALILADEPVSSLDPRNSHAVVSILSKLSESTPVLGVFHQPSLATQFCTRILGIREGQIFYDGPPELDSQQLADLYGAELKAVMNAAAGGCAGGSLATWG